MNFTKFLGTFFDRTSPHDCFLCLSVKFFRTPLLQSTSGKLLIQPVDTAKNYFTGDFQAFYKRTKSNHSNLRYSNLQVYEKNIFHTSSFMYFIFIFSKKAFKKRSHSPTPTHTQPRKGHTHPHPPTSSQKNFTNTHTHPHPAKKCHVHPHPAKKCYTHRHLAKQWSHPAKKRSCPPIHNWKKECHVSSTWYIRISIPFSQY